MTSDVDISHWTSSNSGSVLHPLTLIPKWKELPPLETCSLDHWPAVQSFFPCGLKMLPTLAQAQKGIWTQEPDSWSPSPAFVWMWSFLKRCLPNRHKPVVKMSWYASKQRLRLAETWKIKSRNIEIIENMFKTQFSTSTIRLNPTNHGPTRFSLWSFTLSGSQPDTSIFSVL